MFSRLTLVPSDPLWALTAAFQADPRHRKLDLGLGVYRDETGETPIFAAVKTAEARMAAVGASKSYRPLRGNDAFNAGMTKLLLGAEAATLARAATIQTVGATGALRMLAELIAVARPSATIWLSDPGYHNHRPLMAAAGLSVAEYPWRERNGAADFEPVLHRLKQAKPGDVLLIQGCCHNPTGLDLTFDGWQQIAALCERRGIVPLVDMAYQGLSDGLDADAFGLRILVDRLDTVLIAASCSKNMGLYCERTGVASVILPSASQIASVMGVLEATGRCSYSMPPDHGASVAAALLASPEQWHAALHKMRERIAHMRSVLTAALRERGILNALGAIERHRGMFSTLPLRPEAMMKLRLDHAIYGSLDGRINVAGLQTNQVEWLADALLDVMGHCPEEAMAL